LSFRTIQAGKPVIILSLLASALASAQVTAPDLTPDLAQAQAPAQTPAPQSPSAQSAPIPASPAPPAAPAVKPAPDYPDPRGLMLGAFYFTTQSYRGGDISSGHQATAFEDVYNLGKGHGTPGFEASYPITRTGTVYGEYWVAKYDGNQNLAYQTNPFAQTYLAGSTIATTEKVEHSRFYLDDLLWPHLFPVPRFRVKSIWAVEWTKVSATVDTPGVQASTSATGLTSGGPIAAAHSVILPEFGLAAEYALTPHVLARFDVMGFGIPHHADTWESDAYLSVRRHSIEVVVGGKALHYKTTAQSSDYFIGNVFGGYLELRWHPAIF
jgi:hypothetical protein